MNKADFLVELEDILQREEACAETDVLADYEEWDSLSKMAVMAFYNKEFGIKIALKAKDLFGTYLAVGIIISLFIQFAINLAVVLNLIPITGTTLPFISYGGSSLLINFMMVGILINIDSQNNLFL